MAQKRKTISDVLKELIERSNSEMMRLRILEQGADISKTRVSNIEKEMLELKGMVKEASERMEGEFRDIDERLVKVESTMRDIISELKKFITTSRLKEIETLLDIYSPLKSNFITKEEVERMLEERS